MKKILEWYYIRKTEYCLLYWLLPHKPDDTILFFLNLEIYHGTVAEVLHADL